jgi:hypothetical protein
MFDVFSKFAKPPSLKIQTPGLAPIARYAFLAIDVEVDFTPKDHLDTNKKISVIADELRFAGVPVFWFTFPIMGMRSTFDNIFIARPDRETDTRLTKQDHSVFKSKLLKRMSPDKNHLILCGYNVSVCVLETIKDALQKGYEVTLLTDGTNYESIDFENRTISFRRNFCDRLFLGKEMFKDLQTGYPSKFHLKTHLEFLRDFELETGTMTRLMSLKRYYYGDNAGRAWTYACV